MDIPEVPPGLILTTARVGDHVMFRLAGYIDLSTAPDLRRRLQAYAAIGVTSFELDAQGVTFMDSSGLALLADLQATLIPRDGRLVVTNASDIVYRLLTIACLHELLDD